MARKFPIFDFWKKTSFCARVWVHFARWNSDPISLFFWELHLWKGFFQFFHFENRVFRKNVGHIFISPDSLHRTRLYYFSIGYSQPRPNWNSIFFKICIISLFYFDFNLFLLPASFSFLHFVLSLSFPFSSLFFSLTCMQGGHTPVSVSRLSLKEIYSP